MHHSTCVTHVPWCRSGSLTRAGGENVPDIPGACALTVLRIWQEAHEQWWMYFSVYHHSHIFCIVNVAFVDDRQGECKLNSTFHWCQYFINACCLQIVRGAITLAPICSANDESPIAGIQDNPAGVSEWLGCRSLTWRHGLLHNCRKCPWKPCWCVCNLMGVPGSTKKTNR